MDLKSLICFQILRQTDFRVIVLASACVLRSIARKSDAGLVNALVLKGEGEVDGMVDKEKRVRLDTLPLNLNVSKLPRPHMPFKRGLCKDSN